MTGSPLDFCTQCSVLYCIHCSMLYLSKTTIKHTPYLHIQHKNDPEHVHQRRARSVRIFTLYAAMDQLELTKQGILFLSPFGTRGPSLLR